MDPFHPITGKKIQLDISAAQPVAAKLAKAPKPIKPEAPKKSKDFDLDACLVASLIASPDPVAAVQACQSQGVVSERVDNPWRKVFDFLVQYVKHGSLPSAADVEGMFGVEIPTTNLDLTFMIKQVSNRTLYRAISDGLGEVEAKLKHNNPEAARDALSGLAEVANSIKAGGIAPTPLFALAPEVKERMAQASKGLLGYPSPWESINLMTTGWVKGTNSWFIARPGVGKTWLAILCARHVWKMNGDPESVEKPRVLVVSPEMSKVDLAERFFTIEAKVPYGEVVAGKLPIHAKAKFEQLLDSSYNLGNFWVIDDTDDLNPQSIAEAIDAVEADLVVIDAAYRIKWNARAKDRFENFFYGVEIISNWSKRKWSGGRKIAVIADSQMNRDGAKSNKATSVALSDNLVWEADNLFSADQISKNDGVLYLNTLKVRRMASFKEQIALRWDMVSMLFDEIEAPGKIGGGGDKKKGGWDEDDIPY